MDKFESKITRSSASAEALYSRMQSLENLAGLVGREEVSEVEATADQCTFRVKGAGRMGLRIVDREPFKTLKFTDVDGKPLSYTAWIQFKEVGPGDTRIRITLHTEIPFVMRAMLKGKIRKGLDQAAEAIASMPA
ncbi:MAG: polyketide cyclase [Bacteroidetes bacterium]|nr:MAG: polyketide cyclase [Bacteroidota bacterium]